MTSIEHIVVVRYSADLKNQLAGALQILLKRGQNSFKTRFCNAGFFMPHYIVKNR